MGCMVVDVAAAELDRLHERIAGPVLAFGAAGEGAGVCVWAGGGLGAEERVDVSGAGG